MFYSHNKIALTLSVKNTSNAPGKACGSKNQRSFVTAFMITQATMPRESCEQLP